MTDDDMRHLLAEALWRIDTGGDSPPLAQASPASHRVYARAATDLLPTVRAIAAAELRAVAVYFDGLADAARVVANVSATDYARGHAKGLGHAYSAAAEHLRGLDNPEAADPA